MSKNPFVRRSIASVSTAALFAGGLLFAGAPAANANAVSQPSLSQSATGGCNVRVWARAANVTGLRADATAVAFAGASAFAKIILEEVRTVDANKPAGKAPVPNKRQIDKAPVVHTMDEADTLSAKLVKRYERKIRKIEKRIKVIKLTLKRSKTLTVEERRELKRELRQAKKALKKLHANPPRMKGAHGMGFENTGYRDRKDLQPYADKVDGQYDVFQYVPELRDWIIIVKVAMNGTWVEACHNYVGFYIPPNTPDRSMFLIVRVITDVRATVTVHYTETITLTVGAEATDSNGKVVDYDEKTVTTTKSGTLTREGVPVTSMEEAIQIGEEMVRAAQQSRVGATATVSDSLVNEIGAELNVTCPPPPPEHQDTPPSMQCHAAQHIWVGEDPMVAVFDLTDPDGTPVSFDRLEKSGPIEVVLTEDTTISGGKRRTLTIRAGWVPEGTEQAYSLKLFGSSGGKQTSCLAEGTVKNNDTGWKTFQLWSKELDAGYAR